MDRPERVRAVRESLLYELRMMRLFGIVNSPLDSPEADAFQLSPYAREYWQSIKNNPDKAASESIFPFVTLTHFLDKETAHPKAGR